MKILITGHTSGLGKFLLEKFTTCGHTVIGASRSNGYNIHNYDERLKIVELVKDCDLFINNAHSDFDQCYLLEQVESDINNTTTVVTIGSMAGDYVRFRPRSFYPISKLALEETHDQLYLHSKKRLIFIKPGYMENKIERTEFLLISFEEVYQAINYALSSPRISKIELNNKLV